MWTHFDHESPARSSNARKDATFAYLSVKAPLPLVKKRPASSSPEFLAHVEIVALACCMFA